VQGCPIPSEDRAEARELFEIAAKQGSRLALSVLARERLAGRRGISIEMPAIDQYAWRQMYRGLAADGCFGTDVYLEWAASPTESTEMSAATQEQAQAATQLLSEYFDKIRRTMGCSD
jgi:hypothetical protein